MTSKMALVVWSQVMGYSAFTLVGTAVAMKKAGFDFVWLLKTASKLYPKLHLQTMPMEFCCQMITRLLQKNSCRHTILQLRILQKYWNSNKATLTCVFYKQQTACFYSLQCSSIPEGKHFAICGPARKKQCMSIHSAS